MIDRSRLGSLGQLNDYLQLARIYTQEGQHHEAEKLTSQMRKLFNSRELGLVRTLLSAQRHLVKHNIDQAQQQLNKLFDEHKDIQSELEPEAMTNLLELCFQAKMQDKAYGLVSHMTKQHLPKSLLDRIRAAIALAKKDPN